MRGSGVLVSALLGMLLGLLGDVEVSELGLVVVDGEVDRSLLEGVLVVEEGVEVDESMPGLVEGVVVVVASGAGGVGC